MNKFNLLQSSIISLLLVNLLNCIFIKSAIAEKTYIEDSKTWIEEKKISKKMDSIYFVEDYNKFKNYTIIKPEKREELGGLDIFTQIYFDINRYEGDYNFFFATVTYKGDEWLYIDGDLYMVLNGNERIHLQGKKTHSDVLGCTSYGCNVEEGMTVVIPDEILLKMAKANSIEVRIEGNRYYLEAYMKKDHHAQIRVFVETTDIKVGNNI